MKSKDEMFIIDERIRKENIKLKVEILEKNKEIERLNNIIDWQQNKIVKLNSENVCLKAKNRLYEDGYILDKASDKE